MSWTDPPHVSTVAHASLVPEPRRGNGAPPDRLGPGGFASLRERLIRGESLAQPSSAPSVVLPRMNKSRTLVRTPSYTRKLPWPGYEAPPPRTTLVRRAPARGAGAFQKTDEVPSPARARTRNRKALTVSPTPADALVGLGPRGGGGRLGGVTASPAHARAREGRATHPRRATSRVGAWSRGGAPLPPTRHDW